MKVHIGILVLSALLAGCSTSEDLLPTNGQSMRDVWDKNAGGGQLQHYRSQDNRAIDPVDYISKIGRAHV